jgi:hypothetical protein
VSVLRGLSYENEMNLLWHGWIEDISTPDTGPFKTIHGFLVSIYLPLRGYYSICPCTRRPWLHISTKQSKTQDMLQKLHIIGFSVLEQRLTMDIIYWGKKPDLAAKSLGFFDNTIAA